MNDQVTPLAGWTWNIREQSNGVYRVSLTSQHGPKVEKIGTDEAELVRWCLDAAKSIDQQLAVKFRS